MSSPSWPNAPEPDAYARHVSQILDLAEQRAGDLRWGLTTPVIEDWHNRELHRGFARYNADIDACNTCARALAAERGIACLDLPAATARFGPEAGRYRPDGVHFTPETAREQGRWLAEQCRTGRAAGSA
jgi:lysophospholipase L1-like esterase